MDAPVTLARSVLNKYVAIQKALQNRLVSEMEGRIGKEAKPGKIMGFSVPLGMEEETLQEVIQAYTAAGWEVRKNVQSGGADNGEVSLILSLP